MGAIRAEIRERLTALGPTIGVWSGDITRLEVDAIVTAANRSLSGGGGVDGAIHRAAGPALLEACLQLPEVSPGVRCPVGEARITPGFRLGTEHVIHAVGPVWDGGTGDERCLLASAYRESLVLAVGVGAQSVAVPAISTGAFGFPVTEAARIAVDTARAFQRERKGPERIVLVAFDDETEQSLREALGPDRLV
ncbi:MAG: O-acetyl-ADP-ribose deacetylase [Bacteroidota bacterium]